MLRLLSMLTFKKKKCSSGVAKQGVYGVGVEERPGVYILPALGAHQPGVSAKP